MKRDAVIVAFNESSYSMNEDVPVRRTISPAQPAVEFEDMTDVQKHIVIAGQTIAGSFPENLTKEELHDWIKQNLF